jgi:hypothetical protein
MEPLWADAASVAAAVGHAPRNINHRLRAVAAVEKSGLVAPDQSGKCTRASMTKQRVSAAGEGGLAAWRV